MSMTSLERYIVLRLVSRLKGESRTGEQEKKKMSHLRKGRPSFGKSLNIIHDKPGTRNKRKNARQGDEHIV